MMSEDDGCLEIMEEVREPNLAVRTTDRLQKDVMSLMEHNELLLAQVICILDHVVATGQGLAQLAELVELIGNQQEEITRKIAELKEPCGVLESWGDSLHLVLDEIEALFD